MKLKIKNTKLLAELQERAERIGIWGADLLDRLKFDYESARDMEVIKVEDPTDKWVRKLKQIRCRVKWNWKDLPFKRLPNCGQYHGLPNPQDWISELFGFARRQQKQGGYIIAWRNGVRNKFLIYMFRLLGVMRDRERLTAYWRIANSLMKNDIYMLTSFNYVIPGWEKTLSIKEVVKILKEVKELIKNRPVRMDYQRVYIEKANGKWRPLGVPTKAWRVYLHMWNNLISWQIDVDATQHGFRPGRGTGTAWAGLIRKLRKERNIYEFDLVSFFDKVNLKYNYLEMVRQGVPKDIAEYIYTVNRSLVKLRDIDLLPEGDHREVIWNSDKSLNMNLPEEVMKILKGGDEEERTKEIERLRGIGYKDQKEVGVPQGSPTSCSLSILNLRELFEKLRGLQMYADDGLYFPLEEEVENISIPAAGVEMSPEKSKWVKRSGEWLSPLKYLGLEYIPAGVEAEGLEVSDHARLRAKTRGGSLLEYGEREQFWERLTTLHEAEMRRAVKTQGAAIKGTVGEWISENLVEFEGDSSETRIEEMFKGKLAGQIQARMYNGSWTEEPSEKRSETIHYESWVRRNYGGYVYRLSETGEIFRLHAQLFENMNKWTPETAKAFLTSIPDRIEPRWEVDPNWREKMYENLKGEIGEGREVSRMSLWGGFHILVMLTTQNSSTFACDDILTWLEKGGTLDGYRDQERKTMYHSPSEFYRKKTNETWKEVTEESLKRRARKTTKKIRVEFQEWVKDERDDERIFKHMESEALRPEFSGRELMLRMLEEARVEKQKLLFNLGRKEYEIV